MKHENSKLECRVNDLDVEIRALNAQAPRLSTNVEAKTPAFEPQAAIEPQQPAVEDRRSTTNLHQDVIAESQTHMMVNNNYRCLIEFINILFFLKIN